MYKMRRFIVLAFLPLLALAGCADEEFQKPFFIRTSLDYGQPAFRQGYHDGCVSAMAAYGNSNTKTWHAFTKTAAYKDEPMYNQVWGDAYNFCYMKAFMAAQPDTRQLF